MANTTVTGRIGDQEVELINAASEATLLKLLEAMNKMAGIQTGSKPTGSGTGTGTNNAQTQAKASNEASVALNKAGQAVGKFAVAIADATKSVLGFVGNIIGGIASSAIGMARELLLGGSRVSDFTQHLANLPSVLGMFGSAIHTATLFIEKLVDNYQTLSQVGANFGNSLVGMVRAAAKSGMGLEDFTKFIASNSEKLAMLNTSVTAGAKRFGELSKGLRESDVGRQLLKMGFTVDELNDTLLNYNVINARLGRDTSRSNKEIIESTGKFATELNRAAQATGVNRKAIGSTAEELSKEAAFMAAAMRLPENKRAEFIAQASALTNVFPQMKDVIIQGIQGIYNSPEMIALNSQMPEFISIIDKFRRGQIGLAETQDAIVEASKNSLKRMQAGGPEALAAAGNMYPNFKKIFDAIQTAAAYVEKRADALKAQKDELEDANILMFFTTFSDMIKRFRSRFAEMIITSEAFNTVLTRVNGIFGEADSTLEPLLDKVAIAFNSLLMEINEFIVTAGSDGLGKAFKNAFTHLLSYIFLTEEEMMGGEDGWLNNEQQALAVQEKVKTILLEGFKSMISVVGDMIAEKAKTFWEDNKIGLTIAGAIGAGLLALFAVDKIKNLLPSFGGAAGGATASGGSAAAGAGAGGFLSGLGAQFTQAAGWLMKGAAIGGSMIAIGFGLTKLAEGIAPFKDLDLDTLGRAGLTLGVLVGAVALLGNVLSGPQLAKFALGTAAIAGLGWAIGQFPKETLRELSVMMSTVFAGIATNIEKVFTGIGNIIDRITSMRTAVISATTEQIKQLAGIPADNMFAAAKGIQAIKNALDGFAPGVFSGISQGIGNLFAPDKVGPLDKMATLGPKLEQAAVGFTAFKSALAGFSLASLDISNAQVSNFVRMTDKFPDFNSGVDGLTRQASGLNSTAAALNSFNQAAQNFDVNKFTFTREQLSNLADGTVKLRALAEQLRLSRDGFQKLDTQGLKNIKEGVEGLSKAFKDFNESFVNKFLPKFEETRGKTQEGLLTSLGSKLDTLNSSVASLVAIEDTSKGHLDKLASGRSPTIKPR